MAAALPPVTVLGINETRRGKPVWVQDPDTHRSLQVCDRWHTGFVDAAGSGGLHAQVEDRCAAVVTAWVSAQPQAWRLGITHAAIDLSTSHAKAVREGLPHAVLVGHRFPIIRLANDTVTAVRPGVIRAHEERRGRSTGPAWQVRRRLLTAHEHLRPHAFTKMRNTLVDTSGPGKKILHTHVVKEELRTLLTLFGTHPERHLPRRALHKYYASAPASGAPEIHPLATTIETW
jgi:transposase